MTIEMLAEMVRGEIRADLADEGFTSFCELKRCNMMDSEDIKDYVHSIIDDLKECACKQGQFHSIGMTDDNKEVFIGLKDFSWGEFKKMVFVNI